MVYISYNKAWENKFDNIFSKRDKLQVLHVTQLKLQVHDTFERK